MINQKFEATAPTRLALDSSERAATAHAYVSSIFHAASIFSGTVFP